MKVRELISMLENVSQDADVFFKPQNSSYPEEFDNNIRENVTIRAFWGNDFTGTIITSGGQVGGI